MPADFFIDPQLGVVFSKATGVLGWAEAVDHMDRLASHPDFQSKFNQLFDFRPVSEVTLSYEQVQALATRPIFSGKSKRAFVVSSELQYGLARVFGTYRDLAGEPGVAVFREMNQAISWLSLSAEPDPSFFPRLNSRANEA